jgi:transcriptional regulator with XRE-family HTH domain
MTIKQKQKRTSRLRYWRRLNELSQARAARMAGISRAMWALLENGLLPGDEVASKLSALFGEPADGLQKPASARNVLRVRDGEAVA